VVGGGSAGDVVGGGVGGLAFGAVESLAGALFGGGRNGPFTPHATSAATTSTIVAARSIACAKN
jgi:hypothetical protein